MSKSHPSGGRRVAVARHGRDTPRCTVRIARVLAALAVSFGLAWAAPPAGWRTMQGRVEGLAGNDHALVKIEGPVSSQATTRTAGLWEVFDLAPGTYTVTPVHGRYTFEPAFRTIAVTDANVSGVDFAATRIVATRACCGPLRARGVPLGASQAASSCALGRRAITIWFVHELAPRAAWARSGNSGWRQAGG